MDSHFISWDEPNVRSTIKTWNDDEFLSWDRPVSVKKEPTDDGGGVPKDTSKSTRIEKLNSNYSTVHELLGSRVAQGHDTEISWLNILETKNVPWLTEHVLLDQILFPVSGYISMAVEAADEVSDGKSLSYTLRDVSITSALLLNPDLKLKLQTKLLPIEKKRWYKFQITSSSDGSKWIERCVGRISSLETDSTQALHPKGPLTRNVSRNYWYDVTADSGLRYGSKFRNLDEISTSVTDLGAVASGSAFEGAAKYLFHPVTMEQSFQILMVAECQGQGRKLRKLSIPSYIETLVMTGVSGKLRLGGQVTEARPNGFTGNVSIISNEGQPAITIQGCRMSIVSSNRQKVESKLFSTTEWSATSLKATTGRAKKVTLLVPNDNHPFVMAVKMDLKENGIEYDTCSFEDAFPPGQDVISLLDLSEPWVYNFTKARFQNFTKKMSAFKGSMIWVTPSAQMTCKNPNTSLIIGLTRTLRVELKKDITTIEVDVEDLDAAKGILQIYQGLGNRPKSKDLDPDYEYVILDGEVKISRLHWTTTDDVNVKSISFRPDACYLLIGGLGGLGREISRWMVENGARNLFYLSRSAKEGPDTTPFFNELRSLECSISTFAGSVSNLDDVEAAVRQAMKPIAGVMQMSAVMRDNFLSQMTFSDWETCVQPKVKGTWNLHHALSDSSLDFFLLFSSICGITGQWGQANYNSANSFLDAFVKYRHGQGLAASVIDIGFMGGVGMATENAALVANLKKSGYYFLSELDLLDALAISIAHSRPGDKKSHFALGITTTKSITASTCRTAWKKDARMLEAHQFIPPVAQTVEEVENLLDDALGNASN